MSFILVVPILIIVIISRVGVFVFIHKAHIAVLSVVCIVRIVVVACRFMLMIAVILGMFR